LFEGKYVYDSNVNNLEKTNIDLEVNEESYIDKEQMSIQKIIGIRKHIFDVKHTPLGSEKQFRDIEQYQ
jgi:hypothetical protein